MAVVGSVSSQSNSINGWNFDVGNDRIAGGSSTVSMSIDGNRVTVTGNLTQNGVRDTIIVPYSDLRQAGWGRSVRFNKNNITGLQIAADTGATGTGSFRFTFVVRD